MKYIILALLLLLVVGWKRRKKKPSPDAPGDLKITIKEIER